MLILPNHHTLLNKITFNILPYKPPTTNPTLSFK